MEHVNASLPDYITGRIEAEAREVIERHLALCAACREEHELLRRTFAQVADSPTHVSPPGYFATVLPRVRMRLDNRRPFVFRNLGAVQRLLPLVAAGVALFFLWNSPAPVNTYGHQNPLLPYAGSLTDDEWLDGWSEQLFSVNGTRQELAESDVYEELAATPTDWTALGSAGHALPEELNEAPYQSLISGLSEQDLDELVERLGERINL